MLELENVDSLHYVMETVAQTRRDLPATIPLIGFAGAPSTLASYAIEGGVVALTDGRSEVPVAPGSATTTSDCSR